MTERKWKGLWINDGKVMGTPGASQDAFPAPYFRKTFSCNSKPQKASVFLCGLGWHVLYINGTKADDRVLSPTISQFDKHVSYIEYDVTRLLKKGKNAIVVLLGNGLYNCRNSHWNFSTAPWRDYPKLICDVVVDGKTLAKSDNTWIFCESPVTFNEFRNGQYYDARREMPGFAEPNFDDSKWRQAIPCIPPGGRLCQEIVQPCKVMESYAHIASKAVNCSETTYDFGTNLTGWCRLKLKGKASTIVEVKYAEQINPLSWNVNTQDIAPYANFGRFQTDQYIMKGDEEGETYEPFFTYHGFRYAQVGIYGKAELLEIKAQFVHTSFQSNGSFDSSDTLLNKLQRNTLQSYRSNFTGIPTDCPHREKNGWTGDAQLAAETGIWNFDMERGFANFLQIVTDTQRPSGQLPGIAPTGGWGFNFHGGPGPAWDNVLFEYPYLVYLFYGDDQLIRQYYECFKLYLEYCESRSDDYLLDYGLGDWCHWNQRGIAPVGLTSSAYYYQNAQRTAFFAEILGHASDRKKYSFLAQKIKQAFLKKYANDDGTFARGEMTSTAAALYFGLIKGKNAQKSIKALLSQVREFGHKADFGILGAKFVPRVLADYGYADDALEILTQREFPGWGWQIENGATSLWENWNGVSSQNHIMFGDVSAWMYRYLAGFRPLPEAPGFRKFIIQPCFVKNLNWVKASHEVSSGTIRSSWKRSDKKVLCDFEIPKECTADIILPGKKLENVNGQVKIDFTETK